MLRPIVTAAAAVFLLAAPAAAQSRDDVNARLDMLFGEHEDFEQVFDAVQAAVLDGAPEVFAQYVAYPFTYSVDGVEYELNDEADFVGAWDDLITEDIANAVIDTRYEDLFVNSEGAMFGQGEVWMTAICADEACATWAVKVITIQHAGQ